MKGIYMADCECLGGCLFFNDKMADMPATANLYKTQFCKGDNTGCARHQVFRTLGKEAVPTDLYPNDTGRAKQIIG